MSIKHIVITVFCYISLPAYGQFISSLSIGDSVQSDKVFSVINAKDSTLLLNDATEDLVLLDFWATWCGSCITKFPQLDSLQRQFERKMKIILVNWDEQPARIQLFLSKYSRKNSKLTLPVIVGDTVLRNLFPHTTLPHYVWIYKRKMLAATGPEMVNAGNISKLLTGERITLKIKKEIMDYDNNKPLLENGNGGTADRQLYRSIFTRELEGLAGGYRYYKDSITQHWTYVNFPVLTLYQLALGFDFNRVIIETKTPVKYRNNTPELFSYELTGPIELPEKKAMKLMQSDLNNYLGLAGAIEKRQVDCYVIKRSNSIMPGSQSGKTGIWESEDHSVLYLRNIPFETFVRDLNYSNSNWPAKPIFINESRYAGNISIDLPLKAKTDTDLLSQLLAEKGFVVKKERRVLDVFVLRDPQ